MSSGSSPITSPLFLQKRVRSKGPSLHPVSGISQVICPSPTPARTSTQSAVAGRYPTSGTGLPRCIRYFPDMPSSLPRWTRSSAPIGSFLACVSLPRILGGSASTPVLSRPAQGSLALRPAGLQPTYSCTSVSRASGRRSPYLPVWIATGLNRLLPGRNFHPLAPYTLVAHLHLVYLYFRQKDTYCTYNQPFLHFI